jgi:ABC-type transport system substrate-binding protein
MEERSVSSGGGPPCDSRVKPRRGAAVGVLVALLGGCDGSPWNSPYPAAEESGNTLYSSFSERPKHLDPVRSYSENEYAFIAQIYEPPLQYDYLIRPYQLVPLTALEVPEPRYLDEEGRELPQDAPHDRIAYSRYEIRIRPGIRYQPHPAFAVAADGRHRYLDIRPESLAEIQHLADFAHTGTRDLTAEDYVYQIKRLAHPRLHSPIAGLMSEYIVGLREYAEALGEEYTRLERTGGGPPFLDLRQYPLSGAETVDRYTYRITIRGSYAQFVYWLAMPFFAPMPWEVDRLYSRPGMAERNLVLDWYPVGTGPYMLVENNPNRRMVLERNPSFRGEPYPDRGDPEDARSGLLADAGRPMPFIDRAVYSLEKEDIPYWSKFLQGYYDTSGITSDSFDQAIRMGDQGDPQLTEVMREKDIRLVTAVRTSTSYFGFNMLDPVVGGYGEAARRLRQALSVAVDVEEYISIFANGRGVAAQGPVPPGIFGHVEGEAGINPYVYRWVDGRAVRRPLEDATRLLAEAGYPNGREATSGKPLVLYFDTTASGPDDKSRLDWMRKQLGKLGIQLVIRATDYNRFQEKMRKGTAQIYQWGWNADYPDPENFLFLLYGPNGKAELGGENASNYSNPDFDRLFDQMKNMADGPDRQAVIDRMVAIAREDAPWMWGLHPKAYSLHHAWYSNVKVNQMANNTLKYRRIDGALRTRAIAAWNRPVAWPLAIVVALLTVTLVPAYMGYRRRERSSPL